MISYSHAGQTAKALAVVLPAAVVIRLGVRGEDVLGLHRGAPRQSAFAILPPASVRRNGAGGVTARRPAKSSPDGAPRPVPFPYEMRTMPATAAAPPASAQRLRRSPKKSAPSATAKSGESAVPTAARPAPASCTA